MSELIPTDTEWGVLARYFAGESSVAERAALDAWASADPQRASLMMQLHGVWRETGRDALVWNAQEGLRTIRGRATAWEAAPALTLVRPGDKPLGRDVGDVATTSDRRAKRVPRIAYQRGRWSDRRVAGASLAAAALVMASVAGSAWVQRSRRAVTPPPPVTEVATRKGQQAKIRLSDGTRIDLAPDSRIRYSSAYGTSDRIVTLDGEAYFDVAHDERRPFTVRTRTVIARDLGTSFGVRAYNDKSDAEIVVAEGSVSLRPAMQNANGVGNRSAAPDSVILLPLDRARVTASGAMSLEHGVDIGDVWAWRDGRIVFHNTPLARVARDLERRFDVVLTIPDSTVGRQRVTVDIPATTSFQDVLGAITIPLHLRAERSGRVVVLRKGL